MHAWCPSRGFGGAAGFSVFQLFQLWVQEGAAQAALNKACPRPVAKSFLHVGDAVVRRQDTSRTCVQVVEPRVRDVRVTRVLDPRHLLPRPSERSVFFWRLGRVLPDNHESCAWRCGVLSRLLRGVEENSTSSLSSS